ncbi:MAG: M28 family metallopeptidase [Isosphaeraceae bacterium]
MSRLVTGIALWSLLAGAAPAQGPGGGPAGATSGSGARDRTVLLGFTLNSSPGEREAESRALAVPTPEHARRWLKTLTQEPHVAGTPADYRTALFVRDRLQEWGWKVEVVPLDVLLNYPNGSPRLELNRPRRETLALDEKPVPGDRDSASSASFGAFNGYGVGGVARGQVVYANYGRAEDFEALEKQGISIKGKVVLARYGGNFRGLKVLAAQRRGAQGVLIFSDPADDGYAKGDVYPSGPFRPGSAIQRGSVQFLSLGPGDPSTPNGPSSRDAKRLPVEFFTRVPGTTGGFRSEEAVGRLIAETEKQTGIKRDDYFATIPSLPIGYDTAAAILKELAGPNVPAGWQGGLPLAYHVGPGPAEVSFSIEMDYGIRTIWNVIATIPGSAEPDRWIMVGNHRDAWVYGAVDPGSGTATTLEMCRAIGEAVKAGWKPRRTIVYASWDAEEYGLVGSTEWAELNAKVIDEKVALLLNVDSAVSGKELDFGGVPSLRDLTLAAAGAVTDVRTGKPLGETWLEGKRKAWAATSVLNLADPIWDGAGPAGSASTPVGGFTAQMHPLGSGSDYTVFLDHLGVPAVDIGFSGGYGVYHSIYDNFNWMEKHGDPEFLTHTQAARLYTTLVMRASAAEILPLRFTAYGQALRDHVDELRLIRARAGRAMPVTGDGGAKRPDAAEAFPGLGSLVRAVRDFQARAVKLDEALDALARRDGLSPGSLAKLNERLARIERAFLLPDGLPGRPWFKHAVYAPGLTTGYGAWPFPGVRQTLEEHRLDRLPSQVERTVEAIARAGAAIDAAAETARGAMNSPEAP